MNMKPQKLTQLKVGDLYHDDGNYRATFEGATIWSKFAYCQVGTFLLVIIHGCYDTVLVVAAV